LVKKTQTPPTSKAPETAAVDDSWDDLVFSALGESKKPPTEEPPPDDIFERATAIPVSPPDEFGEIEGLGSNPPSGVYRGDAPDDSERPARTRTAPEPVVYRMLERIESGKAHSPADVLRRRRTEDALELDLGDRSTPLDLAGLHGRAAGSSPAIEVGNADSETQDAASAPSNRNDMQDRYAVGDFTGALVVAESILDSDPDNEDAKRYAQSCREVLMQMYAARLGPMDQVPSVVVPADQITWLSLDHRAGFLLSLVDGVSNIEEILDVSGMSRLDALRIMYTLAQQNVIVLSR